MKVRFLFVLIRVFCFFCFLHLQCFLLPVSVLFFCSVSAAILNLNLSENNSLCVCTVKATARSLALHIDWKLWETAKLAVFLLLFFFMVEFLF